jgi:PAS domain S-box-containing protein
MSVGVAIAVSVTLGAVGATAFRHRAAPGAVPLGVLTSILATTPTVVSLGHFDAGATAFAFGLIPLLWRVLSVVWFWFVLEYTGRGPTVTWRGATIGAVVALAPQVVAVVLASLGQLDLGGVAGFILVIGWNAMFVPYVLGLALLVRSTDVGGHTRGRRGALLGVGSATMLLFVIGPLPDVSPGTRWWLFLGALGTVAVASVVAVGRGVFDDPPSAGHLARELVLDEMTEAAVAVDRQGRVLDANSAAEATFSFDRPRALGHPVESVIGFDPAAHVADEDAEPGAVTTPTGTRQFEVNGEAIRDTSGTTVGWTYRCRDVTERATDEQRLTVLNRVLRHNLRNDLDAVRGFAESIETGAEHGRPAARIRDLATEIADTGGTVAETERLLSASDPPNHPVAVEAVVRSAAELTERGADGTVSTSTPTEPSFVRADRDLLTRALRELVENGLEHADHSNPTVELAVETTGQGVVFTVRDDGPGIPARERGVLLDGDETPLRHGTGVGLWFVHWAVTRLGGELSFSDPDDGGSVVTVVLPADDSGTAASAG